jgi:Holliday junction resolvase-like predicted endonuclease
MNSTTKSKGSISSDNSTEEPLSFEKVWRMFQDTDKKFQDTDKKLNKLERLFTSQWGKLVESLVEGDIISILNQRGIEVTDTIKRRAGRRDGIDYEFDIIAINGSEIVIVEVKTTLRPEDVRDFIKKLGMAKTWMPEYANKRIYGAVAFLSEDSGTVTLAERKGLFVIRATGDSASIINRSEFVPKTW